MNANALFPIGAPVTYKGKPYYVRGSAPTAKSWVYSIATSLVRKPLAVHESELSSTEVAPQQV